jgi:hypothetical protein
LGFDERDMLQCCGMKHGNRAHGGHEGHDLIAAAHVADAGHEFDVRGKACQLRRYAKELEFAVFNEDHASRTSRRELAAEF